MRVLVLGGDGFCGWPTSLYLSDRGYDVTILDNLSRRTIDVDLEVGSLTPREREVLGLMAEGRSNAAIAARMFVTEKAVSKHTNNIFAKLQLPPSEDDNRRVLAVLAYLNDVK